MEATTTPGFRYAATSRVATAPLPVQDDVAANGSGFGSDRVLGEAARRVLDHHESWFADALNFEEVENRLLQLIDAAHNGADVLNPARAAGERILQQRLLDLLRAELLAANSPGEDPAADRMLLETLGRLEAIRRALDPQYHQLLPARLAGTDALTLVVEVVHDLRSPLTSIMFLAETLRKAQSGPINDAQRKQLGIIYSAALGLTTVATDVIALSRGGDVHPEARAPFSMSELLDSVRDMVRPLAEEKGLELRFRGPPDDARTGNSLALGRV
ncbi:MAG: sensor histidine kinase, partial [Longimicrobiales bacterium]